MSRPLVAVLAVQGDFEMHRRALERLGAMVTLARTPKEILAASHLVLPGGESTTMLKFLALEGLEGPIRELVASGRPVFGTCAGAILLAREVRGPVQHSLGLLDATIERNAYGRQLESFSERVPCPALGEEPLDAVFIRAPVFRRLGAGVETLAARGGEPVLVRERNVLAATFHPELTEDTRVHAHFLAMTP